MKEHGRAHVRFSRMSTLTESDKKKRSQIEKPLTFWIPSPKQRNENMALVQGKKKK